MYQNGQTDGKTDKHKRRTVAHLKKFNTVCW